MGTLVELIGWVNLALFTVVALVALRQWRAGRGKAGIWAALAFVALALVADFGTVVPDAPRSAAAEVAFRLIVAVLVLPPYLLYRFTTAFQKPTLRLERLVGVMTLVVLAWTFLLPEFPAEGEPGTPGFTAYLIAFLVHWTVLSVVVAVRLWRAGSGQPSVARRRMRMLTFASLAITVALVVSAASPDEDSMTAVLTSLLVTASAVAFLVGLAPPYLLRVLWRRPEQGELQEAIARLMSVTTEQGVADEVLPPTSRIVSARGVALRGSGGRVIATYGIDPERGERLPGWDDPDEPVVRIEIPTGELIVWTTPYAPFFGTEELRLLRTLGALTGLALDHARLFARSARPGPRSSAPTSSRRTSSRSRPTSCARPSRAWSGSSRRSSTGRASSPTRRATRYSRRCCSSRAACATSSSSCSTSRVSTPRPSNRIVTNLVVNALRYGEPPVLVGAEHRDRHFRIRVEDRGSGVPPDFVPQLFERFARSEAARAHASGSGLGLAIAASYAKAHGGDLLYQPVEPHGARFELVLPVRT